MINDPLHHILVINIQVSILKVVVHWNFPDKIPQRVSYSIPSHPSCLNHSGTVTGECELHSSLSLSVSLLSKDPSQDCVYEIPLPRFRKISY